MARRTDPEPEGHRPEGPSPQETELFWQYIDRINAGEDFVPEEIVRRHPEVGPELVSQLEAFRRLARSHESDASPGPLGALGDYTLRRQIGRGGMGIVYEAWENSMDRAVALKVLPGAVAADDRAFNRFMREARTAGQLSHPNVVPVFAMGVKENTPYFAMELVEGQTMAKILASIRDAEPETKTPFGHKDGAAYFECLARAFADVADGLQHAHSKRVVHRDIKPSNLILDKEGRLRILDFGLARLEGQESLTISGDVVGTPLYMSPEQAARQKIHVDHRTDVYSLGATLYETLTGRPPFRGKDHAETLSQIIERSPGEPSKLNPRVPKDFETIVLKCLRKSAGDRFGTSEALAQDLRRFVRGDPVEARPEAARDKLTRALRRFRRAITVGAVGLVLLAAIAAFALASYRAERRARLARYEPLVRRAIQMMPWSLVGFRNQVVDATGPDARFYIPRDEQFLRGREAKKQLVESLRILRQAAAEVPSRPSAPYYSAYALSRLGREDETRRLLRESTGLRSFPPAALLAAEISGDDLSRVAIPSTVVRRDLWEIWLAADLALRAKKWSEASQLLDRLVSRSKHQPELFVGSKIGTFLRRGFARLQLGKVRLAEEDFMAARTHAPTLVEPVVLLGKAYVLEGYIKGAESAFDQFHRETKSKDVAAQWFASLYLSLRRYKLGIAWAERIQETQVRETLRAAFLFFTHQHSKAVASAEKAVEIDPADEAALVILGWALKMKWYFRIGPEAAAGKERIREVAERLMRLAPESPQALAFHGAATLDEGSCRRAVAMDSANPIGHIALGFVFYDQGKPVAAERELRRALKLVPDHEQLHIMLGVTFLARGLFEQAREHYQDALRLRPDNPQALNNVGWTYVHEERFGVAAEYFRRSIESGMENGTAHAGFAVALWRQGDLSPALESVLEAIRRVPDDPDHHDAFRGILEDRLLERIASGHDLTEPMNELAAPARNLERVLALDGVDSDFLVSGALLRLYPRADRDLELALRYASQAVASNAQKDSAARSLAVRGLVRFVRGERRAAMEDMETALKLNPENDFLRSLFSHFRKKSTG